MTRNLSGNLRWAGLWLLCAIVAGLLPAGALRGQTNRAPVQRPPAPRRASIILILADNVGYGDLGCYGQTKIKTPNLDRLAAGGIRFTSFYTGSPEDGPARAALLTGIEPVHSHPAFNQALSAGAVTIAALLKQSGYYTGLIGEWALGDTGSLVPAHQGFDQFAGFLSPAHASDYFTDRLWRYDPENHFNKQEMIYENEGGKRGLFIPDLLTTAAVNFVRINEPDQFNHYRPFFLCLAYPMPHAGPMPGDAPYANEPWPTPEKYRAAMISRMDAGIGHLLDTLKKAGMNTNTVVVFTSVGGPRREDGMDPAFFDSAGPLRGDQGSLHDGGLRVPMIVRWPASIQPGQVSDFVWAGWDFLPTAMEIALGQPPKGIDGISVLPTLLGEKQKRRHEFFYWSSPQDGGREALRTGDWKIIRTATNNAVELYDLKADPGEKTNLAAAKPKVAARLEKLLATARAAATNAPAQRED